MDQSLLQIFFLQAFVYRMDDMLCADDVLIFGIDVRTFQNNRGVINETHPLEKKAFIFRTALKYMRVHRSIYSSRADLKSANTRIENKITHILEPLAAMAFHLGFEYHRGLIEAITEEPCP